MADSAVQESNSVGKGFFRTFKDSFFWTSNTTSVSRVSDTSEEAEGTRLNGQSSNEEQPVAVGRADVSKAADLRDDEEDTENARLSSPKGSSLGKTKSKSKFFKKKEIISSSTAVPRVEICTGKKCRAKGSEQLLSAFESSSGGRVEIAHTTCMKVCKKGMNVRVTTDGTTFDMHNEVVAGDCKQILSKHFEW